MHDNYYDSMPDCVELAKQLDLYIAHIQDCLAESEDDNIPNLLKRALAVREDVRNIYEE